MTTKKTKTKTARTRYEVRLPDGGTASRSRSSGRPYTHAVATRGKEAWFVLAFVESIDLAEAFVARERRIDQRRRIQSLYRILPTYAVPMLSWEQRTFLVEIGDESVEVPSRHRAAASLAQRGLLRRRRAGLGWWTVCRTQAGRRAVGAAPRVAPSASTPGDDAGRSYERSVRALRRASASAPRGTP